MWKVSEEEFQAVQAAPVTKRYKYFLNHVADEGAALALKSGGELLMDLHRNEEGCICLWPPYERYVQACVSKGTEQYSPFTLDIQSLKSVLDEASVEEMSFAIFPTETSKGFPVSAQRLRADLNEELDQY